MCVDLVPRVKIVESLQTGVFHFRIKSIFAEIEIVGPIHNGNMIEESINQNQVDLVRRLLFRKGKSLVPRHYYDTSNQSDQKLSSN